MFSSELSRIHSIKHIHACSPSKRTHRQRVTAMHGGIIYKCKQWPHNNDGPPIKTPLRRKRPSNKSSSNKRLKGKRNPVKPITRWDPPGH
ncbi:hypothetical protein CDAR_122401 [Caerostris darwini]|uniref:Uncharacterized protein n=1 Tax=Caerostris darwini TaxID=1538125 RepID=A0AAV4M8X3_9ARAC|nr:hypothetical protein CDAR_122401 [Caerostris darwini]